MLQLSQILHHVCPSSKARNELELLGAGKSCTGVSDPTNNGFSFVPERFDLVNPSIAPGTVPINGLEIADAGGEGILFITGVPTGVEVAIGLLADRIT